MPDDYFTPTIADLKARQQQLHAKAAALNNAPLLTRAQREEKVQAKRDRWPNVRRRSPIKFTREVKRETVFYSVGLEQTTIRVRFPDLTQLEKTFPSSGKIRSVYAFVRDALREDVKPMKFVLCLYLCPIFSIRPSCLFVFPWVAYTSTSHSVQPPTARPESIRSCRTRSHPSRARASALLGPPPPIPRRHSEPYVPSLLSSYPLMCSRSPSSLPLTPPLRIGPD